MASKKLSKSLQIYGVIGDPVSHSLSPIMHNAAFAHLKLPALYQAFWVRPQELKKFIQSIPEKELLGFNVTIPHKETILPYLHTLSREAKLIEAVNTVVCEGGKLHGHNTDLMGFIHSLEKQAQWDPRDKTAIVLGAGGAARAVTMGLAFKKIREILIINRNVERAYDLSVELNAKFPRTRFRFSSPEEKNKDIWQRVDLLVNTTPLGMKGLKSADIPFSQIPKTALVADIVYTPLETDLIKKAKNKGLPVLPGWSMLLHQGVLAFELWTNKKAPIDIMEVALLKELKN